MREALITSDCLYLALMQISVDEDTYHALEAAAKAEGKTIAHVAMERLGNNIKVR